ncbi:ABC transporter substrate-binding protein [Microbacterium sp. No. 7]|uniref:ABC transporter substrate-binding protein n=1 Tax=Microbacterium sp. No. 7 TaxID=1714373 RepID=UPI0006D0609F|nr:ABC transporter substrate-binding protein [Microbacterium sp. No. 7]
MSLTSSLRTVPVIAVALSATLLLSSCSSGSGGDPGGDAGTASSAAAGERVDGGSITVYSATVRTIDPRQNHGFVGRALADSLLDIDPETFEYKPWLATDWSVNDDQTEFTFVLRDDVTFTDGTPFDAEAVKANFDGAKAQIEQGSGWYIQGLFDFYAGTDVVSDTEVVVRFSEPNPAFLPTIPTSFLSILSPASFDNTLEQRQAGEFVGTGPFVLDSYTPNEQITLTRNEDYAWASGAAEHDGPASLESITVNFVDEQSVRENALLAGEIQLAQNPTVEGSKQLVAQGFDLYYRAQSGNPYSFVANFARPLTKDIDVRRALAKVIDRDTIQQAITTDIEPASTSVLTPQTYGYADQSDLIGFDLEGAAKILDDAGWVPGADGIREKDGQRLSLIVVNWWEPKAVIDALQLIKEDAAKAGIEIELVVETPGGSTWASGEYDFLYNNATRADGGHALYGQYTDAFLATQGVTAADVTEPGSDLSGIIAQSFTETDVDVRADLLAQAQQIIVRDAVRIPIFDNVNSESGYFAADPRLHGLRESSISELVLADAWLEQ